VAVVEVEEEEVDDGEEEEEVDEAEKAATAPVARRFDVCPFAAILASFRVLIPLLATRGASFGHAWCF